ncbi:MAG TPA: selenide, water dikinase SelD, partial [Stellaceae bacterium]|nr:selenide, water dikinase SelD [Stellaceae bacterium]
AHPREKAGVFAVRQGPPLTENLRLLLKGEPPRRFIPQRRFLSLIGTGGGHAIAVRGRFSAEGAVLWRLKTAIDRRWMAKYRELPVMEEEPDMRCGGCGAKVPAEVLARVMTRLGRVEGPEDAAIVATPPARRLLQSVDFFRAFLPDPYLFGRIGANHALNDIFAMGGKPLTVLAIATVPAAADALVEEDLFHMLRGGLDQIEEAGARLIGGHSAEGKELALGFAVTGSGGEGDRFLLKGGLKQGDRLLLTKPLGTGTLLAAEMRGRARAPWIEAAIASMLRSNAAASIILRDHGVSACTDVTGFGLLGHLVEMLRASKVEAGLSLDAIPVIEGAQATAAAGILSTGQPGNLAFSAHTLDFGEMGRHPSLPLLFDPQTSGGLLAGVPAEEAASCLEALRARGYDAAEIGRIEGDASVRVRLS